MLPSAQQMTPALIESILRGALTGTSPQREHELYSLMEQTWPRLAKNIAIRLRAYRETEAALKKTIIQAELAGQSTKELRKQLADVSGAINKQGFVKRAGFELVGVAENIPVLGSFMRVLNGAGGTISLAITGLTALAGAAAACINAFSGAQDKMAKMDAVLANAGTLTDAYREQLQDLAGTLQDTTAIADDDWLGVLAKLSQFGADSSNIEQYADAVKNLAGIIGGDITTAGDLMARAIQGNFEMLGRYGINVEKAGTQTERLDSLMAQLATRGGGVLEAQGKTLSGQWRQLTLALDDLMEGIGNLIARTGILQATMGLLTGTLKALQSVFPSLIPATEGLGNKWKSIAERAEETRAKIEAQKTAVKGIGDAYGQAGMAIDTLNASLDASHSRTTDAINAAKELADAQHAAAKAAIARAVAEGKISKEEGAAQTAALDKTHAQQNLDFARQEQAAARDTAQAKIQSAKDVADAATQAEKDATRDTAKNTERIAKAITTPAQKGELAF